MSSDVAAKIFSRPDWSQPIFAGIPELLPRVCMLTDWPDLHFFNELAAERRLALPLERPLRFMLQPKKKSRWRRRAGGDDAVVARYDQSVLDQGLIPTRLGSWHDLFNNISWLLFPQAKVALVERLAASYLERTPEDLARAQFRSREGDRLAILDEGGVIELQAPTWQRTVVFGHALQEAYVLGRHQNIRCMSLRLKSEQEAEPNAAEVIAAADRELAIYLRAASIASDQPGTGDFYLRDLIS